MKYKHSQRKEKLNYIKYLEIHLADSCNLNCKGCCHFSPLAKEKYPDLKELEEHFKCLSMIIHAKLKRLIFLGGEPLLNSDVEKYLIIAKKYFPNTDIQILTNGILLPFMKKSFWDICNELDIQIDITMYPINIDYEKIIRLIKSKKIRYFIYDDGKRIDKKFDQYSFDKEGTQNAKRNFYDRCVMAKDCAYMTEGKIYPCQLASNISIYNNYFNENYLQSEEDYIDIYKVKNEKEIYDFLSKPIPFCKYCDFSKVKKIKWDLSKRSKEEWSK